MRIFVFLFSILFISCSTENSPSKDVENSASKLAQNAAMDSLQVDISTDFVTGQFDFKTHEDFVQVDPKTQIKKCTCIKKLTKRFRQWLIALKKTESHLS